MSATLTKRSFRNGAIAAALIMTSTLQVGCNGTQAGAVVGAIAGAAIGSDSGVGGIIAGAAIGGLIGAAYGTLLENEPYYYYDSYHVRRSYVVRQTYEVREVRYIPVAPRGYVVREETVYVARYRRNVPVRRWYYNNRCEAQYYVVTVYDSAKGHGALALLDPSNPENVARSSKNWGLPEATATALLGKEYLALEKNDGAPVTDIFKKELNQDDAKQLEAALTGAKADVSEALVGKVARSLSGLAGEQISAKDARAFIESGVRTAAAAN